VQKLGAIPLAAVVLGAVPMIFTVSSSSSETVNGVVVASSHIDYVAAGAGPVAALLGIVGAVGAARAGGEHKGLRLAACGAAVLLGVYAALRGFGALG
jgi:hypothetical protein